MSEIDPNKLAFDTILIRKAGDSYNPMPVQTFVALPVNERIDLIMGKRLRFFADEVEVPVFTAVKSLNEAAG